MRNSNFQPSGISFGKIDGLVREKKDKAVALYMAYACIAYWQKTYRIKATTSFMAKRTGWSDRTVIRHKKTLLDRGLIEDVQDRDDDNKIKGHYIQVNHLVGEIVKSHTDKKPQGGSGHSVESCQTSASLVKQSASLVKKSAIADSKAVSTHQSFGEFGNVKLKPEEYKKLVDRLGGEDEVNQMIERLSGYLASKGKKYKSHYATMLNWARRDGSQKNFREKSIEFIDSSSS